MMSFVLLALATFIHVRKNGVRRKCKMRENDIFCFLHRKRKDILIINFGLINEVSRSYLYVVKK